MSDAERRIIAQPVEIRANDSGELVLGGYAAVYMKLSRNLGGFVEQVHPQTFRKSLADNMPVRARYNHDDAFLLGTTEGKTLRLFSDDTGLGYEVDLPDTTAGVDVGKLAKRGDIRYSSFMFHALEDEWSVTENGFPLRTLLNAVLLDVSPVVDPAYYDSSAGLRSLAAAAHMTIEQLRDAAVEDVRSRLLERGNQDPGDSPVPSERGQGDPHPVSIELLREEFYTTHGSAPTSAGR